MSSSKTTYDPIPLRLMRPAGLTLADLKRVLAERQDFDGVVNPPAIRVVDLDTGIGRSVVGVAAAHFDGAVHFTLVCEGAEVSKPVEQRAESNMADYLTADQVKALNTCWTDSIRRASTVVAKSDHPSAELMIAYAVRSLLDGENLHRSVNYKLGFEHLRTLDLLKECHDVLAGHKTKDEKLQQRVQGDLIFHQVPHAGPADRRNEAIAEAIRHLFEVQHSTKVIDFLEVNDPFGRKQFRVRAHINDEQNAICRGVDFKKELERIIGQLVGYDKATRHYVIELETPK